MRRVLLILLLSFITTVNAGVLKPPRGMVYNHGRPPKGLVAGYAMNGGSGDKVFDLSCNGNHIDYFFGDPSWGGGKYGVRLNLDNNDYVRITDYTDFLFTSNDSWTIVAGVKVDSFGTDRTIARIDESGAGRDLWLFRYSTSNQLQVIFGDIADLHSSTSTRTITDSNVHQVATVVGGGRAKLYIDGINEADDAVSIGAWSTTPDYLGIGAYIAALGSGTPKEFLDGGIEYFYIFDRALSASEIALLYSKPFDFMQEDLSVSQVYSSAAAGNIVTPYYYRGLLIIPIIPFGLYLWRRTCAA